MDIYIRVTENSSVKAIQKMVEQGLYKVTRLEPRRWKEAHLGWSVVFAVVDVGVGGRGRV
jgi:hypothetical protein